MPYLLYDLETISVIWRSSFFRSCINLSISYLSDYMWIDIDLLNGTRDGSLVFEPVEFFEVEKGWEVGGEVLCELEHATTGLD